MRGFLARRLWRLVGRRLGWVALASVARTVLRFGASRRVDEASADLEQRLPEPVRSALDRVPGDPIRIGGGAVVAGRSARQVAAGAGRLSRAADDGRRRLGRGLGRASAAVGARPHPARAGRDLAARFGAEVRDEAEHSRRDLRSQMLLNSRGRTAADDALLDRRTWDIDRGEGEFDELELLEPPPAVPPGRRRAPRRRAREQVARVQRTYRQPRRPWDR